MDEFKQADAYLDAGKGDLALPVFHKLAEQGRLDAMHSIAHTYLYGIAGVKQDYDLAFRWFTRAANLGCPQAMYHLGMCHGRGFGTPVDFVQSAAWYRRSAEHDDEDAMYEFGKCCEEGIGVEKNVGEAKKWYRLAAGQGQKAAEERLQSL